MSNERPLKTHTINADTTPPDAHAGEPPRRLDTRGQYPTWGALRWLFLFRLLMVVGLILAFSPAAIAPSITPADTQLAWHSLCLLYTSRRG